MAYNFTEKKRIRKSFAKRKPVLDIPYLLETQLASYRAFLQEDTTPTQRKLQGLEAAFQSIFPIKSHNGMAELDFLHYTLGAPAFDVRECQPRGQTFEAPIRSQVTPQSPDTTTCWFDLA